MANYTEDFVEKLSNITPPTINTSIIQQDNIFQSMVDNIYEFVGNNWFYGAIILIWLYNIMRLRELDQTKNYDTWRAILVSSGWSTIISGVYVLFGYTKTIIPLTWFGTLLLLSWYMTKELKKKGL